MHVKPIESKSCHRKHKGRRRGPWRIPALWRCIWPGTSGPWRRRRRNTAGGAMRCPIKFSAGREDAEECVNDTYVKTWNAIPPPAAPLSRGLCPENRPKSGADGLSGGPGQKRGGGQPLAPLQELADCVTGNPEAAVEQAELSRILEPVPPHPAGPGPIYFYAAVLARRRRGGNRGSVPSGYRDREIQPLPQP